MKEKKFVKKDFIPINFQIKAFKVKCINAQNEYIGLMDKKDAISLAKDSGLDLVQISFGKKDEPPTCKITDGGKYKYDLSKKNRENAKKQRESSVKIKEIKLRPNTDYNDLKTKAAKAFEFINDGDRVKISIAFKGREIQHKDIGLITLKNFVDMVPNMQLINEPLQQGKTISVFAAAKKQTDLKKAG